jgi:hypothetical protein
LRCGSTSRSRQSSPAALPVWARRLAGRLVKVALFDLNAVLGERVAGEIGGVFCRVDVTSEEGLMPAFHGHIESYADASPGSKTPTPSRACHCAAAPGMT